MLRIDPASTLAVGSASAIRVALLALVTAAAIAGLSAFLDEKPVELADPEAAIYPVELREPVPLRPTETQRWRCGNEERRVR